MKLSEISFIQIEALAKKAAGKPRQTKNVPNEDTSGWKKQISLEQFIAKEQRKEWHKTK